MLTAGADRSGQTKGEVCPRRCKTGENRAAEAGHGRQVGDFAAAEAIAAPFRLPVGLGAGYSGVNQGQMGRPSGKYQLKELDKSGLIAFPTGDGPVRLTPNGIATALALEIAAPILSAPEFSTRLSDLTGRVSAGKIGPREALVDLLPILAPNEPPETVGPRTWNTLSELDATLTQSTVPLPAALVGAIWDDDLPQLADVEPCWTRYHQRVSRHRDRLWRYEVSRPARSDAGARIS